MIRPSSSPLFRGVAPGNPYDVTARPQPYNPFPSYWSSPAIRGRRPLDETTPAANQNPDAAQNPGASSTNLPQTSPSNPGAASNFFQMDPEMATIMHEAGQGAMTPEGYQLTPNAEPYNFRIGPAVFRVGAGLRAEFTDNVDNASSGREGDLITTPEIYIDGHWRISRMNDVSLRLGIGYSYYLEHPELNSFSKTIELSPTSNIEFKAKAGDFYFTFYERPILGVNTANDLTAPSGLIYSTFTNNIGLSALWDLNAVQVSLGYQRTDEIPLTSSTQSRTTSNNSDQVQQADQNYVNDQKRSTDSIFSSVNFRLTEDTSAGLEGAFSVITYHGNSRQNGVSYHAGAFVGTQLTQHISLRLSGGYQIMHFEGNGNNGTAFSGLNTAGILSPFSSVNLQNSSNTSDSSDTQSPYFVLALTHRVNRFLYQTLSISHESSLGTTSNSEESTTFNEQVVWTINQSTTINFGAFYQTGKSSGGPNTEPLHLFGLSATTGWDISKKLRMNLYYEFTQRTGGDTNISTTSVPLSTGVAGSYSENRIGVNFTYAF